MYYQILLCGPDSYEVSFIPAESEAQAFIQAQKYFLVAAENTYLANVPTGFWLFVTNHNHIGVTARFYKAVETPRSFTFA